nr:phage tail tape measure protein [uncultured Tyzzerella sp.]
MESIFKLSVMVNMIDNITGISKKINENVTKLKTGIEALDNKFKEMTKSGFLMVGTGTVISKSLLTPVKATYETKKALGELASLGYEDLQLIENAAKDFSNEFAGTTKAQFITASYDIKSGISSLTDEGVAEFTKLAGLTAKATKSTIEEMTSLFATGYGIYKDYYSNLSDIEFGEMFSAGISKSVQQFKTTGSEMASAIESLGGTATSANVPLEEQLAILGMLQATMSGSEAGTKYTAFLNSAGKAGQKLGLNFTDANNRLLSMPEILEQLKNKFGETLDVSEKLQLQEAFGTEEAVKLIDLLYNKTGDLQNNILTLYDTMGQGTNVASGMVDAMTSVDDGQKFILLKQRIQNIVEEIGNNMLPVVNSWLDKGAVILEHINIWISENGDLVGNIGIVAVSITGLVTAIGGLKLGFGLVGGAVTTSIKVFSSFNSGMKKVKDTMDTVKIYSMYAGDALKGSTIKMKNGLTLLTTPLKAVGKGIVSFGKQAFITATTQLPALITSCWSFTAALLANPITWIVIAIIALIGVIILLWTNWDKVSAWLKNTWNSIVNGVIAGWEWLKGILQDTPNWLLVVLSAFMPFIGLPLLIIKNWDTLKQGFINIWNSIKESFNNFFTNFIPNLLESGKKIMTTIADGIKSAVMAPVNAIKGGFAKVRQYLPFSDAKEGPLSDLTLSGSRINTTIAEGMNKTKNVPAKIINDSFTNVSNVIDFYDFKNMKGLEDTELNKPKTVNLKEIISKTESNSQSNTETKKDVTKNFYVQFNVKDLEDLKKVIALMEEITEEAEKETA